MRKVKRENESSLDLNSFYNLFELDDINIKKIDKFCADFHKEDLNEEMIKNAKSYINKAMKITLKYEKLNEDNYDYRSLISKKMTENLSKNSEKDNKINKILSTNVIKLLKFLLNYRNYISVNLLNASYRI